jgi:CubicO group peptidase (beta-lactamase class C family)
MKMKIQFYLILLIAYQSFGQNLYFPPRGNDWQTMNPKELGWCDANIDALYSFLDSTNSKAFIVLKDGKIVLEKYFKTFTQDSNWLWNSAGKTLTGFSIGIAQQEGFLSLDDMSSKYLGKNWTSCTPEQEDKITIRHQITMTTGLDDGTGNADCTSPNCLLYKADAGTRWAYHNGPYTLLDQVISKATNATLSSFVNSRILTPIGAQGAYFKFGDNNVFISKPRSMARFGLLLLAKGNWNGVQILKDQNYFQQMTNSSQMINPSYGYLTWLNGKSSYKLPGLQFTFQGSLLNAAPSAVYAAIGKNGQIINVDPASNLVFVRMGDAPSANSLVPTEYNNEIWNRINQLKCQTSTSDFNLSDFNFRVLQEQLVVECSQTNIGANLYIYNSNQQIVIHRKIHSHFTEISLRDLPSSVYTIIFQSKDGVTHKRFYKS